MVIYLVAVVVNHHEIIRVNNSLLCVRATTVVVVAMKFWCDGGGGAVIDTVFRGRLLLIVVVDTRIIPDLFDRYITTTGILAVTPWMKIRIAHFSPLVMRHFVWYIHPSWKGGCVCEHVCMCQPDFWWRIVRFQIGHLSTRTFFFQMQQ